jgi:hypothetical protein
MERTEIILHTDGTLTERIVRERELDVSQAILDALTEGVTRVVRDVFPVPNWGMAHANVGNTDTVWTVPIDRIPLHARFKLMGGILVPMFESATDLEVPLVWKAPETVRLAFSVITRQSEGLLGIDGNWLFAFDEKKRAYRLPLPNLHDDCRICTGAFGEHWNTAQQAVVASLEQFHKSKWNADLMRTVEQSQKFFRFQPTNETFETLPVEAENWTTLCNKVSTAVSERVVL